jgi:hypothetical protein
MRTRTGDAKTTARIVLEGLQGTPGAEMGTEHQLSPSQDHQRREQWPAHAPKALERQQHPRQEARLEQANTRLPKRVGALTRECNHSDERLAWPGNGRVGYSSVLRTGSRACRRGRPTIRAGAAAGAGRIGAVGRGCRARRTGCGAPCGRNPSWSRPISA